MKIRVIIDDEFGSHEDLTGEDIEAVYFEEEELLQIGVTKKFDLINKAIIPYDNTQKLKEHKIMELRMKREVICFPIINRGKLWYDKLSESQILELNQWYNDWLNVTITLVEPKAPDWLF